MKWKNFWAISSIVTVLHYGEDVLLLWLGRYTHIDFLLLLLFPALFGGLIGYLAQIAWVRRFLNED